MSSPKTRSSSGVMTKERTSGTQATQGLGLTQTYQATAPRV